MTVLHIEKLRTYLKKRSLEIQPGRTEKEIRPGVSNKVASLARMFARYDMHGTSDPNFILNSQHLVEGYLLQSGLDLLLKAAQHENPVHILEEAGFTEHPGVNNETICIFAEAIFALRDDWEDDNIAEMKRQAALQRYRRVYPQS